MYWKSRERNYRKTFSIDQPLIFSAELHGIPDNQPIAPITVHAFAKCGLLLESPMMLGRELKVPPVSTTSSGSFRFKTMSEGNGILHKDGSSSVNRTFLSHFTSPKFLNMTSRRSQLLLYGCEQAFDHIPVSFTEAVVLQQVSLSNLYFCSSTICFHMLLGPPVSDAVSFPKPFRPLFA